MNLREYQHHYGAIYGRYLYEMEVRQLNLREWAALCHYQSKKYGWWPDEPMLETYATKIALIHSEVSEMLEGLRKGKRDDHLLDSMAEHVEAADVFIRLMDYCGARNIDIERLVKRKLEFNRIRDDHKLENRASEGGKKI